MTVAIRRTRMARKSAPARCARKVVALSASRLRPPRRFLVVDDDVDARLLMGAMVESYFDAQAVLVASADEAVGSVKRALPDLVITDGLMPGGGAIELLERLRLIPRAAGVPVIVATASTEPDLHRRLASAGAVAVLAKPPSPEALARAVEAALAPGGD